MAFYPSLWTSGQIDAAPVGLWRGPGALLIISSTKQMVRMCGKQSPRQENGSGTWMVPEVSGFCKRMYKLANFSDDCQLL